MMVARWMMLDHSLLRSDEQCVIAGRSVHNQMCTCGEIVEKFVFWLYMFFYSFFYCLEEVGIYS